MSDQYKDLESVVQKYVLGRLTDAEQEEFEAYYLARPDVIDMVETASAINEHAASYAGKQENFITTFFRDLLSPRAFAYGLMLAVGVGLGSFISLPNNDRVYAPSIELVSFSTEVTRSAKNGVSINLTQLEKDAGLLIKVKKVDYPMYQARLVDPNSKKVLWESDQFSFSASKDFLLVIPNAATMGTPNLIIDGLNSKEVREAIEFCHYKESCN